MKTIKKGSALAFVLCLTIILTTLTTSIAAFAQTPDEQENPAFISTPYYSNQLQGDAIVKQPFKDGQLLVEIDGMDVALIISEKNTGYRFQDRLAGFPGNLKGRR